MGVFPTGESIGGGFKSQKIFPDTPTPGFFKKIVFFEKSWGTPLKKIFLAAETFSNRFSGLKNLYIREKISFHVDLEKLESIFPFEHRILSPVWSLKLLFFGILKVFWSNLKSIR